jgi:hypothetical protein
VSKYPRTDAARLKDVCRHMAMAEECTRMEYELNEAKARIKRLEEAGDALDARLGCGCMYCGPCRVCQSASENWNKAKESKP